MTDTDTLTIDKILLESSLRSPRFREGQPIPLGGQEWHLPKPRVSYRATFSAGVPTGAVPTTDLGPEFDRAVASLDEDDDADTGQSYIIKLFNLAAVMLRYNYNLTDDQLSDLLVIRMDDDDLSEVWRAITGTARGTYSPKVLKGSSDYPS